MQKCFPVHFLPSTPNPAKDTVCRFHGGSRGYSEVLDFYVPVCFPNRSGVLCFLSLQCKQMPSTEKVSDLCTLVLSPTGI
jgi:hypothetical protein